MYLFPPFPTLLAGRAARAAGLLVTLWLLGPLAAQGAPPAVEVSLSGVSGPLREALRSSLSLVREQGHPLLTDYRVRALHRMAPEEIQRALQPFGYYQAEVEASLERQAGVWQARYAVTPGPPVWIDAVDIRFEGAGRDDPAFRQWYQGFPLRSGDRLVHSAYEQAKDELLALARQRGYFDAQLTQHQIRVRLPENRASIELHMATGVRYRFGDVTFSDVPLRRSFLERFSPFEAGDPFQSGALFDLQRALTNSDYFQRVDVVPQVEQAEQGQVPVDVRLEMQKRTRYTLGVGYGTDTGPRTTLGVERRWLNRGGHRADGEITASELRTELSLNYRIPLARPRTDFLGFTADWTEESTTTASRETALIGAALTQMQARWQRTLSLNYQEEAFEVGGLEERSTMLVPGIGWQRLVADTRLLPQHGWRLAVAARGASEALLSATDLTQVTLRGKHVTTAWGGRLLSRFDLGTSETSDFDQLPVSLRFFAGGDNSVRGYTYNSLGPEDSDGDVVGGKHLLVASVEYDRFWSERMGGAIFFDQGNAFNSSDFDLHQGAGVGLRYRLPFGLIRVDLAAAVSEPNTPWRLHVNIGPEL